MNPLLLAPILLAGGCVLDRTGRSVSSVMERELALQRNRFEQADRQVDDLARRVDQLEEVARYRGRQEEQKLDNLDQVVSEIQRLRGAMDVLDRRLSEQESGAEPWREDADFRLGYLERRAEALEKALGLPPPPPPEGARAPAEQGAQASQEAAVQEPTAAVPAEQATPESLLDLADSHLEAGRTAAARAVLRRFLELWPDDERSARVRFELAETWFREQGWEKAILRYEDVVEAAEGTPLAASAMLRQGQCFQELGRQQEARLFWEDVVGRYPKTDAAEKARGLLSQNQ